MVTAANTVAVLRFALAGAVQWRATAPVAVALAHALTALFFRRAYG